jgi:signal transduction histidine kinase
VGICIVSPDGRIVFWNRCLEKWTGIPRSALLGDLLVSRFPNFDTPTHHSLLRDVFQGSSPGIPSILDQQVFPISASSDKARIQRVTVTSIPAPPGGTSYALHTVEDFSEPAHHGQVQRSLREESGEEIRVHESTNAEKEVSQIRMQHAQRLESLGILAGGIAHEFNSLLTGIMGSTELVLMEHTVDPSKRHVLEKIQRETSDAADLARLMLAYAGRGNFDVQSVNLTRIIQGMDNLLEVAVGKSITLHTELDESLPNTRADAAQMRQIVFNLLTNAAESLGEEASTVHLKTGCRHCDKTFLNSAHGSSEASEGTYVFIEVSDTGCGMDNAALKTLFDPFFTTKFVGRGLGMAAVFGIVSSHSGVIDVHSTPGEGTVLRVLLPASPEPAAVPTPSTTRAGDWKGEGTILVVDDDKKVREITRKILERFGFDVIEAEGGYEGLEVFTKHCKSLRAVVLDMVMPDMDGAETFQKMNAVHGDVPVLLCSGFDEQDAAQRFTTNEPAAYIHKPYRIMELMDKVKKMLR